MTKRDSYEKVLEEGIIAIQPLYQKDIGDTTIIQTRQKKYIVEKNIKTILINLAKCYMLDIKESRSYYSKLLGKRRNIPLVLNSDNIFLPIKTRMPIGVNDGSHSYVNSSFIENTCDGEIILENGIKIENFNTNKTLCSLLRDSRLIKNDIASKKWKI